MIAPPKWTKLLTLSASLFFASAHSEISHNGSVSMLRGHIASEGESSVGSWSSIQLSGLDASEACPGEDEGLGKLAYLSLSDSEEFILTLLLSAYLGGHQVTATIDDGNQFQGYCKLTKLALLPASAQNNEPQEEILELEHENLVSIYTMDALNSNILSDASRYGLHGTAFGVKQVGGVIGQALSFNRADNTVDFGSAHKTVFTGKDAKFAFSLWVKTTNTSGFNRIITKSTADKNGGTLRQMVLQTDTQNNVLFGWYGDNQGQNRRIIRGGKLASNVWQHIVVSYNGSLDTNNGLDRVSMYINGAKVSSSLYVNGGELSDIYDGNGSLTFGAEKGTQGSSSVGLTGNLDQVRLFNRGLTPSEALHLYNEGQ